MRKVGLVFIAAIVVPSLVLAWLAVRALNDQQFALERQQSLLCQGIADDISQQIADRLEALQAQFAVEVEAILGNQTPRALAAGFDRTLRQRWSLAEIGFVVNLGGSLLCPAPGDSPAAQVFCRDNGAFLVNRESAEVYGNVAFNTAANPAGRNVFQAWNAATAQPQVAPSSPGQYDANPQQPAQQPASSRKMQNRKVNPVQQLASPQQAELPQEELNYSRLVPAEGEFHQLIGDATDGMLARFVQNRLSVMFWHRAEADPNLVFGAQLRPAELVGDLRGLVTEGSPLQQEVCVALLNDNAKPVALSEPGFSTNWKRPFVAAEISEALPHWEVAVYLLDPDQLARAAHLTKMTLGLLVLVLTLAIGAGGWLILSDVNRQLRLTRQKTDFVSSVSHELKTPLTSIRMFSELLAEGKVTDREKQRSYLQIIASESARLTRLINNVLDFARLDRGEKKYDFRDCDLGDLVAETLDAYRPHLESKGFQLGVRSPASAVPLRCDRDAVSQVLVNLLSNAEKYSNGSREIDVRVELREHPVRHAEVQVLDRGPGVPRGSEHKVFEQFFRADDRLNSGVQGSGLGLTLARQIARAHGGDVTYKPREGGGSCFTLSLPVISTTDKHG